MEKRKILIVGFGAMGCRHVQALKNDSLYELHILEPFEKNIKENLLKINSNYNDFFWYNNIDDVPILDIAIIATSSNPRFNIFNKLINNGYKKFLLEKIVFQNKSQFDKANHLIESTNSLAYCNFVNRYFKAYNYIKSELCNNDKIDFFVYGGFFGLGCNAIHYLDIFQYLTDNSELELVNYNLTKSKTNNTRGSIYKEFYGILSFKNSKGDSITIVSDNDYKGDLTIRIQQNNNSFLLNEGLQKMFISNDLKSKVSDFDIIPTSKLTNLIIDDIFNNKTVLTSLNDTYNSHLNLFKVFNKVLNIPSTDQCPIT